MLAEVTAFGVNLSLLADPFLFRKKKNILKPQRLSSDIETFLSSLSVSLKHKT